MELLENNILFLIGAGCSKEAGIKITSEMVDDIETLVKQEPKWVDYKDLYYYLKSSILYSEGIFGNFSNKLNIEKLLVVINELSKKEQNLVYPFIGNWNNRLVEIAGKNFKRIKGLEELIFRQLFKWINIREYFGADYYKGFSKFKTDFGYPIRIFSLNYDLCVEQVNTGINVELGFDENTGMWVYSNFEPNPNRDIGIYLYKLHGSIDWERDKKNGNVLVRCAHPSDNAELIFGTDTKLQSTDPYLFYVFELRKYSLLEDCKLLITIGYSFSDTYINSLIYQALSHSSERKLLIVDIDSEKLKQDILTINKQTGNPICDEQIVTEKYTASEFLSEKLTMEFIEKYISISSDVPFGE